MAISAKRKNGYTNLDLSILVDDEGIILQISDDGEYLDRSKYEKELDENFTSNYILNKISNNIEYSYIIGLNQTTIKMGRR